MTAKEYEHISVKVSPETKRILVEESKRCGLSQTEYMERLIEGTLPDRLESKMEAIRDEIMKEIEALRKEVKK